MFDRFLTRARRGWALAALVPLAVGCGAAQPAARQLDAVPTAASSVIVQVQPGFQPPAGAVSLSAAANLWLVAGTPAATLGMLPGVAAVYPNLSYQVLDARAANQASLQVQQAATSSTWNLTQIRATQAWAYQQQAGLPAQGTGITVAVLDTGVDPSQPALAGGLLPTIDVWGQLYANQPATVPDCTSTATAPPAADVCTHRGQTYDWTGKDGNGHGTHVAGIVAARAGAGLRVQGVAPAARVLPIKVANFQGLTDSAALLRGIEAAVAAGARVINVSIGGAADDAGEAADPTALRQGVAVAIARGVVFVAANGNEGNARPVDLPARYPNVVSVAASTSTGGIGAYSNSGPETTVAAPGGGSTRVEGSGVTSTWPTYLTADDMITGTTRIHTTATLSGTSMATPHVSGVAALLLAQEPAMTPQQARVRLAGTARALTNTGFSNLAGFGIVDALAAVDRRQHDAN